MTSSCRIQPFTREAARIDRTHALEAQQSGPHIGLEAVVLAFEAQRCFAFLQGAPPVTCEGAVIVGDHLHLWCWCQQPVGQTEFGLRGLLLKFERNDVPRDEHPQGFVGFDVEAEAIGFTADQGTVVGALKLNRCG